MDNKKNLVTMVIGVAVLLLTVCGATYAYFVAQSTGSASVDVNTVTGTTDNLSFSFGSEINIYATEENFGIDMGNLSDSTTATATLTANNTNNEASANYNMYFVIDNNDFEYTTDEQTAELLLKVFDPMGNELTEIPGIHYTNIDLGDATISGFDITESYGSFSVALDYEINANPTSSQEWVFEVTFVNLDSDQQNNTNKSFSGSIYMTQEYIEAYTLPIVNTVETVVNNGMDLEVNAIATKGTMDINNYYFAIVEGENASVEDAEFIETNSANYEFNNLNENTNYKLFVYAIDENNFASPIYEEVITTNDYVLATVDNVLASDITETSFRLDVSATANSEQINTYYYSIDDGNSFVSSTNNYYVFEGLTAGTKYFVQVYVVDSNGVSSNVYELIVETEYVNPSVYSVVASDITETSITLTASATNGSNNITMYYYSNNGGASFVSSTSNTYTFNNLDEGTEYNFVVYAIDSLNYQSEKFYLTESTTSKYYYPSVISAYGFYDDYANEYYERYYIVNDDGTVTRYQSWNVDGAVNGYVILDGPTDVVAVAAYDTYYIYALRTDGSIYRYYCDWQSDSCTSTEITGFGNDVVQITSYNFYDYDYTRNYPRVYALKSDGTVVRYQSWNVTDAVNGFVTMEGITNAKYIAGYEASGLYVLTYDNTLMYYICNWYESTCTGSEVTAFGDDVVQFSTYNYQEYGLERQYPRIVVLKEDGTVMRYQYWREVEDVLNGYVTLSGITDVKYIVAYSSNVILAISNDDKLMRYTCYWYEDTCTGTEISY